MTTVVTPMASTNWTIGHHLGDVLCRLLHHKGDELFGLFFAYALAVDVKDLIHLAKSDGIHSVFSVGA